MCGMQMSDSPLAQAGRDYFSAEDAQTWEGLLRPGFQLRALAEDQPPDQREPIVAYLGGLPMLPEDVEWPEWKDHGPLNFIAAIDCSQLPAADLDIPLPASGQLLFFYFDGLGDSSVVYSDADSVFNGTRVLYIPDDAEIAEREAPGEMEPFPRLLLTGELIATAPDNENPALIAAYGDSDDPKDRNAPHDSTDPNDPNEPQTATTYRAYPTVDPDGTGFWEALTAFRRDHSPHHQIGGYAMPVQGAVEPEGAEALVEGDAAGELDDAAKAAAIKELALQLVLLAQVDNDSRSGMEWGDTGRLYWMIRRDDLAAGRFDRTTFTWQTE
jgi:hypothetical protein